MEGNQSQRTYYEKTNVSGGDITPSNHENDTNSDDRVTEDYMLETLSLCTRECAKATTIGKYTVSSKEMERVNENDEIHIITNEMFNYDFTPLSSLTISINTMKGVHYYYYGDEIQEDGFNLFKEHIKDYYVKNFQARTAVVSWIRKRKSSYVNFEEFFNTCSQPVSHIFNTLLILAGVDVNTINTLIDEYLKEYNVKSDSLLIRKTDKESLLKWVNGSDSTYVDSESEKNKVNFIEKLSNTKLKNVYNSINRLKGVAEKVKEYSIKNHAIVEFCDKVKCLYNMKMFAQWQSDSKENDNVPDEYQIEELFDYFRTAGPRNEIVIPDPIETWLRPEPDEVYCGSVEVDDEEKYLSRLHFCRISEKKPFKLCYNFSYFICSEGPAACWYVTLNSSNSKSMKPSSEADVDMLMVDIDDNTTLLDRIVIVFKQLIEGNNAIMDELANSGSKMLNHLRIKR